MGLRDCGRACQRQERHSIPRGRRNRGRMGAGRGDQTVVSAFNVFNPFPLSSLPPCILCI